MKARGLRNVRTNVAANAHANANAQLPGKPVTRAALKRQSLLSKRDCADAKQEVAQQIDPAPRRVAATETSIEKLYRRVGDVDSDEYDRKSAELVSCYVKEIFSYLMSLESSQPIRQDFLCQPAKLDITPRMRRTLFDWLIEVHQRYSLLPETLYLTFHLIDYYMCVCGTEMRRNKYQLLGVAAMFLASKYEEIYPPEIADFVYLTDNTYTVAELRAMERRLLSRAEFFLGYPLEIQFLRRYSKVAEATSDVHEMAKYLTELARTAYETAHLPPSALAAACFCLACELLADSPAAQPDGWTPQLEVFSGYSRLQLVPAMRLAARQAVLMQTETKHTAVRRKYASRVYSSISSHRFLADPSHPVLVRYTA